ncbi:DNA cytosine methyltransferase [Streptacidiphilus sp. ASG 303]|uniref:DNA cytosine methyltransferase n=1 Tax=Streptacidiphilus sp. ASG 303 TaxID=2896847 RepID=UPI001E32C760|nr:DNA cytosine methyltransferase [Streptacidiphilus sp. ASG 303]MCD0482336.1 DNA cytosine methyltransferase [Streptacidiphilus sp. ASG 303]
MPAPARILDLFAGPGGWTQGLAALGHRDIGLETDPAACATRAAAGHTTVRADVAAHPTAPLAGKVAGLIASPPCQTWSAAGRRAGSDDLPLCLQALDDLAAGRDTRTALRTACTDPRSLLVAEPLRYALDLRPGWIALEEVPAAAPVFAHTARHLAAVGYATWTGVLNAADYGVPQTRRRAFLLASTLAPVAPPQPTHAKNPGPETLFGSAPAPWVSMADALGWGATDRPAPTVTAGGGRSGGPEPFPTQARNALKQAQQRGAWALRNGGNRPDGADSVRITVAEAAALQTFPPGYPFQGTKTKQFEQAGNAVPPRLAAAVLRTLVPAADRVGVAA